MILKTRPLTQLPDVERIKDDIIKNFGTELGEILIEQFRNVYDDVVNLENVERVTALPTANLARRGKLVLLEGTGGGADELFLGIDTGSGGFSWKEITLT